MGYGLKIRDTSGNACVLTPDVKSIISSGTVTMPTNLWNDNTYGVNIALPGNYDEDDIGVLVAVRSYLPYYLSSGTKYPCYVIGDLGDGRRCKWVNTSLVMLTRNDSTGVMSTFTVEQYKDTYYNFYPVAFWDKLGETDFDVVRLFAGVVFNIYDNSESEYNQIYQLALIKELDYIVYLRNL